MAGSGLAFAAIAELERAIERCKHAPLYFAGSNYPDDEDDVIENTAPFERAHELRQLGQANPTVVEILRAQGRNGLLAG
ncbi:MAG: hypothetical protein KGH75_03600 [Rhodospirillales bacterium]|nr:hypothetical protein [Rhodospirillales bacterium]